LPKRHPARADNSTAARLLAPRTIPTRTGTVLQSKSLIFNQFFVPGF